MAKRFTETKKWEDPWFQDLDPVLKCVWLFILDHCDNAGVWIVNTKLMSFQVGKNISLDSVKSKFGERLIEFSKGKIWIPKFIEFQYGSLSETCFPHKKVIELLKAQGIYDLYKNFIDRVVTTLPPRVESRVLTTLQEEEEDKDKEEEEEKEEDQDLKNKIALYEIFEKSPESVKTQFEAVRNIYPGVKRSLDVEWENFSKKFKPSEIIPLLAPAIIRAKSYRDKCAASKAFCPDWPHFSTWINQSRWTEEFGDIPAPKQNNFGNPPATRDQLEQTMDLALGRVKGH